jgi:membrane-associated phospholipid phosphatase
MFTAKKNLCLSSNLIAYGVVFLACSGIAYSQNLQVVDSVNSKSVFSSKTNQNRISYQKPSDNFYISDSIFSFRSPKGYFPSLLHNFGEQAFAPFHFKTKQWLITGAAIGITAALIHVDNEIDDWARTQKQKHNWINKSSPVITEFGGNYGVYSVVATGLLSAAFKNKKGVQTSLLATQAMITSGVWVHLIKLLTGRERPEADYIFSKSEGGKWYGPYAQFDQDLALKKPGSSFDSFPSGHTATAFSIATVFASQYNDKKAIPILSYSVATLVGISRLTEHKHWSSDVFAGALLGYLCGKQVVAHFNKTHQNSLIPMQLKSKNQTEFTFIQYGNQIGLSLKW